MLIKRLNIYKSVPDLTYSKKRKSNSIFCKYMYFYVYACNLLFYKKKGTGQVASLLL